MSHAMTAIVPCLFRHKSVALRDFLCGPLPLNYLSILYSTRMLLPIPRTPFSFHHHGVNLRRMWKMKNLMGLIQRPTLKFDYIKSGMAQHQHLLLLISYIPSARPDSRQAFIHCITDSLPSEDNRNGLQQHWRRDARAHLSSRVYLFRLRSTE